jgi:hypothetical protein
MGKLTQLIVFLNADKIPTSIDMQHTFTHISKTDKLIAVRKKYKKTLDK